MFVIVRHGNTFEAGEIPRRIGARTDLPLTSAGLDQGQALGDHFAAVGYSFARVLVSPLQRTRQTATAILDRLGQDLTPEPCEWLREIDHGPDEDMPEEAVLARLGRATLDLWDSAAEPPPGWTVDAAPRLQAWRALFATPPAGTTLIVTSNGAARFALLADASLQAASTLLPSLKLPTGGYGVIQAAADGSWQVPVWGCRP